MRERKRFAGSSSKGYNKQELIHLVEEKGIVILFDALLFMLKFSLKMRDMMEVFLLVAVITFLQLG